MSALDDAGYRVVRCDLRGYGETPMPAGPHDDTADVAHLLAEIGISDTAVIGSSGGGRVAIYLAARWPARVTALVLLCTALRGHEPSTQLRAFGEQEDALLEAGDVAGATELNVDLWLGPAADEQTRATVREMQRHAFEVQLAAESAAEPQIATEPESQMGQNPRFDEEVRPQGTPVGAAEPTGGEPDLALITAPSLLVSGAHDLPDFREIAVHLAGVLPHTRHLELDWAGHLPSLERPDLTNQLLINFLNEAR